MKRSIIFCWYPRQGLDNALQLYSPRTWAPRLQDPTIFTMTWRPLHGLLVRFPRSISCPTPRPDLPFCFSLLIIFPPLWPVSCSLHASSSSWFRRLCTLCALCLVCFSLVYFHSTNLLFSFQLKNTVLDISPSKLSPMES